MVVKNTIVVNGKRKTCRIYDNGGASWDRYTVAFRAVRHPRHGLYYPYIAASERPFHPQGFGQHGESQTFVDGSHLGKRIAFTDCPPDVQKFILQSI
jgi:hypothetical protein